MPSVGPTEIVLMLAILAIFVVPVIALVAYVSRRSSGARGAIRDPDPAMGILRQRLATGEIDEAEFERRRLVLQGR